MKLALLPISEGGIGISSANDKYRQSSLYAQAQLAISTQLSKMHRADFTKPTGKQCISPPNSGASIVKEAMKTRTPSARLRLQQSLDPHSGAFLTAKFCGTTELSDEAFSIALRLRLGLDILPAGFRCETHNIELDTLGYHALSCQNIQRAVTRRHNLIRDPIFAQCSHIDRNAKIIAQSSQTVTNSKASVGAAVYTEQRATERTVPGDVMVS